MRRALNLAWYYLTRNGDKKSIDKLRADLIKPLPGQEVSEEVVKAERDMFAKALAAMKRDK